MLSASHRCARSLPTSSSRIRPHVGQCSWVVRSMDNQGEELSDEMKKDLERLRKAQAMSKNRFEVSLSSQHAQFFSSFSSVVTNPTPSLVAHPSPPAADRAQARATGNPSGERKGLCGQDSHCRLFLRSRDHGLARSRGKPPHFEIHSEILCTFIHLDRARNLLVRDSLASCPVAQPPS